MMEDDKVVECYTEQVDHTTNNEMELSAALYTLTTYGKSHAGITVYCDSAYAVNTLTSWMFSWEKKGWIKSDKKVPENLQIIKKYYKLLQEDYSINLIKVKGHDGVLGNELADQLATGSMTPDFVMKHYGIGSEE